MNPALGTELSESLSQFIAAWRVFEKHYPAADTRDFPGIAVSWYDVPLPIYNALFLTGPVAGAEDLDERVTRVAKYMRERQFPGMLFVCEDYLPESLRTDAAGLLAKHNLYPAMNLTGMAADRLLDPVRPLPQLEYRRVDDMDGFREMMDVNSYAYGFPVELGRGSLGTDASGWLEHPWAYMALLDGKPIATTATFNLEGRRYVGLVATLPDSQRRGYAEAVMRKSLEECAKNTGLTRTALHATDAGRPVYLRMGYHDTSKFVAYMPPMHG